MKEEYSALYHELYVYSSDDVSILTGYSDDSTLVNEFLKIDQAYFDLRNKHYENSDDPEEWAVISAVLCCEKRLIRAEQKVVAKEMDSISKKITYIHKVDESMRAYFSILYRNEDNPFKAEMILCMCRVVSLEIRRTCVLVWSNRLHQTAPLESVK